VPDRRFSPSAWREDGTFRDSVVFSVLKEEWPEVKTGLDARLR